MQPSNCNVLCSIVASVKWHVIGAELDLFSELPGRGQRVEKLACRESTKPSSSLAWPSVPYRRPRRHDGYQGSQLLPATPRRLARRARTRRPLLPPPGGTSGPLFRERVGGAALREGRQTLRRPGRLLQAPAGDVLRGSPLAGQLMGVVADRLSLR